MTNDAPPSIQAQLDEMRTMIYEIHGLLAKPRESREWYTVEEVAGLLGKTSYTVREWCRQARIHARKRSERRGGAELWNVSADEVARYKNEGLLKPEPQRGVRG